MTSNALTAPADAPDADRDGPAVPEHIARLLYVVRILLGYGRHLAATIERRAAAPGFSLFAALFGTAKLPVIRAHLHRGILRAATLESLLLQRAATGRDVAAAPLHTRAAPGANASVDPLDEPFDAQVARLTAERAQHDAPVDPDNLATADQIEAEIRARPIARTLADICRDLGVVAVMCTREFWDALTDAIAGHEDSTVACREDLPPGPEGSQQEPEEDSEPEHSDRGRALSPRQRPRINIPSRPVDLFRPKPALAWPRHDVPISNRRAAVAPEATGPPRAAMKLAA
ncbi:MAG TPA: hypothetical protein VMF05_12540 [Stellaceae bacterium]|nr:hypothetical protein [Stellaceae bacterium]